MVKIHLQKLRVVHGVVDGLGPQRWSMDWGSMFCVRPPAAVVVMFISVMLYLPTD